MALPLMKYTLGLSFLVVLRAALACQFNFLTGIDCTIPQGSSCELTTPLTVSCTSVVISGSIVNSASVTITSSADILINGSITSPSVRLSAHGNLSISEWGSVTSQWGWLTSVPASASADSARRRRVLHDYGNATYPTTFGFARYGWCAGGGRVLLESCGQMRLDGRVDASSSSDTGCCASSSTGQTGGSILAIADFIQGTGALVAHGYSRRRRCTGGGGGGLIALHAVSFAGGVELLSANPDGDGPGGSTIVSLLPSSPTLLHFPRFGEAEDLARPSCGTIPVLSIPCGAQAVDGGIPGTTVRVSALPHGGEATVPCADGFVGHVRLLCSGGVVEVSSSNCSAGCPATRRLAVSELLPQALLQASSCSGLEHGNNITVQCPGGFGGDASVWCDNGLLNSNAGSMCTPTSTTTSSGTTSTATTSSATTSSVTPGIAASMTSSSSSSSTTTSTTGSATTTSSSSSTSSSSTSSSSTRSVAAADGSATSSPSVSVSLSPPQADTTTESSTSSLALSTTTNEMSGFIPSTETTTTDMSSSDTTPPAIPTTLIDQISATSTTVPMETTSSAVAVLEGAGAVEPDETMDVYFLLVFAGAGVLVGGILAAIAYKCRRATRLLRGAQTAPPNATTSFRPPPALLPDAPTYWSGRAPPAGQLFRLVPASPDVMSVFSDLFRNIDAIELGTGQDAHTYDHEYEALEMYAAWRVEHPGQWKKYTAHRDAMVSTVRQLREQGLHNPNIQAKLPLAGQLPGQLLRDANEAFLLSGTKPEVLLPILNEGLNKDVSALTGMLGAGIYLAENVEKIDQYTTPDHRYEQEGLEDLHKRLFRPGGCRHPHQDLFFCLVVRTSLGWVARTDDAKQCMDYACGLYHSPERRALSTVPGSQPPTKFHSIVAEKGKIVKRYREFAVFADAQCFVEYVIAYKRVPTLNM